MEGSCRETGMEVVLERDLFMFPFFPSRGFFHLRSIRFLLFFFLIWVVHCPVCYCVILLSGKKKILFFSKNKNRKSFLDFSNFFISF